jgi:hypothetical protein
MKNFLRRGFANHWALPSPNPIKIAEFPMSSSRVETRVTDHPPIKTRQKRHLVLESDIVLQYHPLSCPPYAHSLEIRLFRAAAEEEAIKKIARYRIFELINF